MNPRDIGNKYSDKLNEIIRLDGETFNICKKPSKRLRNKRHRFPEQKGKRCAILCCEFLYLYCQGIVLNPDDSSPYNIADVRRELRAIESHIKSYGMSARTWRVMLYSKYNEAFAFLKQNFSNRDIVYQIFLYGMRNRFKAYPHLLLSKKNWRISFIGEFILYFIIWFLTLGYSANPLRLALAILINIMAFAVFYCFVPGSAVYNNVCNNPIKNIWDAIYFSVVTFTTLGFGDIVAGSHGWARMVVVLEVLTGYTTLGIFISLILKRLDV